MDKPLPVEHILEIYEPGSRDIVWMTFSGIGPFGAISVGDIINPGLWPDSQAPIKVLQVESLEHIIWEAKGRVAHKTMVFTVEVPGAET